jgi:hypothetical protein
MGNSSTSSNRHGKITIKLEKTNYVAGDQVNGFIQLNITSPFPSRSLYLIIEGKESVQLVDSRTVENGKSNLNIQILNYIDTKTEYFPIKEKKSFYSHSFPIYTFQGNQESFPVGQYSFPFSFVLDHYLPGSFSYQWNENGISCYAKTRYKLTAGLRNYSSSTLFFDKQELVINQRQKQGSMNLAPPMFDKEVKNCCFSHGRFKLAAIFGKDEIFAGDIVKCSVAVDAREAKTDVRNLKAELVMCTQVKGQHKSQTKEKVLQTLNLGPIKKGMCRLGENSYAIDLQVHTHGELQATSTGYLVKNSFQIRVVAEVDGCVCCSQKPQSCQTVNIYNKVPERRLSESAVRSFGGHGWAPQTFDPYVCQFTSTFKLPENFENNLVLKNPAEGDIPYR